MRLYRQRKEYKVTRKFLLIPKTMYYAIEKPNGVFEKGYHWNSEELPQTRWLEWAFIVYEREPGTLNFWKEIGWKK